MLAKTPSTALLTMFHTLTTCPIFILASDAKTVTARYPISTPAPMTDYLARIAQANDPDYDYQLFIIQQANLLGLIRLATGYLLIWSQPLPLYSNQQALNNLNNNGLFVPRMLAIIQQMGLNLTGQLPGTTLIKTTALNLKNDGIFWQSSATTQIHNSNTAEQKMVDAITIGNVAAFKLNYHNFISSGEPGLLNTHNSIRNQKNLAIVATTIFTRAALKAQVLPEKAYQLSDQYIQTVEQQQQIDDLYNYILNIGLDFIHEVQAVGRINVLPVITKAQDYIIKHLHDSLTISDVATAIGVSNSYLMKLFKASQGITIGTYINAQRISEAKSLLKYTNDTLNTISTHLGYTTQAYFSRCFSKTVGMAPTRYRQKYQSHFL